jgi:S1-C subfamily serine protease
MKRPVLYSRAPAKPALAPQAQRDAGDPVAAPGAGAAMARPAPAAPSAPRRLALADRFAPRAALLVLAGALAATLLLVALRAAAPGSRPIAQADIDRAVLHTLATKDIPSAQARAFEKVRTSVVLVRGVEPARDGKPEIEEGVGTGVVIVDTGIILTNMHVALAARQIKVEYHDGQVSDAAIVGLQPEHDLAVLRARLIPDDLKAATLRSTGDLRPGDHVVAVGFPFGIGPSASAGVISGLRREFRSPKGERVLTNLIQFDAAANPGNSGGPLLTLDGEVVGIVTAILNPSDRVFIGIGFAVPIENAAAAVGVHPF